MNKLPATASYTVKCLEWENVSSMDSPEEDSGGRKVPSANDLEVISSCLVRKEMSVCPEKIARREGENHVVASLETLSASRRQFLTS